MTYNQKLDAVYEYVYDEITASYPNYGFVEIYYFADEILRVNNYLLPKDTEHAVELLNLIMKMNNYKLVSNKKKYWEFIRNLRNDDNTQQGFVEKIHITSEQQVAYMNKYSDNYYICLDIRDEKPIGFIGEIDDDIRVAVIPEYRRMGVGKFMVNRFMESHETSYAKMFHDNVASENLFKSCGFVEFDSDDNFKYYKRIVE